MLGLSSEFGILILVIVFGVDIPYEAVTSFVLGIGSIGVAIGTIILAIVAFGTSRISRRQSHVTAISEVLRDVGNKEIRKSRKELYQYGKQDDKVVPITVKTVELNPGLGDHIEDVAVSFDRVGLIVDDDKELRQKVLKFIGHTIVDCLTMSSPYLDHLDEERGTKAWTFFKNLADEATKTSNQLTQEDKESET